MKDNMRQLILMKLIKSKKKLRKDLIKIQQFNQKDKINFPDTWKWDNMNKEGIKNFEF